MKIRIKEIETDIDSFGIYSIFKEEKNIAFLDSNRDFETLGTYSFMGINPFIILKGWNNRCYINGEEFDCDVFEKLSQLLNTYKAVNETELPFIGGCIGYLSYDFGLTLENIKVTSSDDLNLPHYYFVFYDNLIVFDNKNHKKYVTACGIVENSENSINSIIEKIQKEKIQKEPLQEEHTKEEPTKEEHPWEKVGKYENIELNKGKVSLKSNFTQVDYLETVNKAREHIRNGDIYIVNVTQRLEGQTDRSSFEIYKDLRKINPAPFSSFLRYEGFDIISSSPERFLKINNRLVETRPIKGTRPRGKDEIEDNYYKNELLNSEKDKSELLMIVDLERNDLSKVCKPGTVKVTELFKLEEYSTVFHLVSNVIGELKADVDEPKCLKACFPGGSITGTPKIRSMEIIDDLEGLKRGIYTGSIGYFSYHGSADFNIVIRTIVKKDNNVYMGVGGGITWESKEEDEYQETLDKAKALLKSCGLDILKLK